MQSTISFPRKMKKNGGLVHKTLTMAYQTRPLYPLNCGKQFIPRKIYGVKVK